MRSCSVILGDRKVLECPSLLQPSFEVRIVERRRRIPRNDGVASQFASQTEPCICVRMYSTNGGGPRGETRKSGAKSSRILFRNQFATSFSPNLLPRIVSYLLMEENDQNRRQQALKLAIEREQQERDTRREMLYRQSVVQTWKLRVES